MPILRHLCFMFQVYVYMCWLEQNWGYVVDQAILTSHMKVMQSTGLITLGFDLIWLLFVLDCSFGNLGMLIIKSDVYSLSVKIVIAWNFIMYADPMIEYRFWLLVLVWSTRTNFPIHKEVCSGIKNRKVLLVLS